MDKEKELSALEHCVLCGKLTAVKKTTNIEHRSDYEIGCGQLCPECSKKLWNAAEKEDANILEKIFSERQKC